MAYKLLQSKAYNNASSIYHGTVNGELWTLGGIAFAEQGADELRLRKETAVVDWRHKAPHPVDGLFRDFPDGYIPVDGFEYDEDNVTVLAADQTRHFQAVYFEYLEAKYKFATKLLNPTTGKMVWASGDKPLALLANRSRLVPEEEIKIEKIKLTKGLH